MVAPGKGAVTIEGLRGVSSSGQARYNVIKIISSPSNEPEAYFDLRAFVSSRLLVCGRRFFGLVVAPVNFSFLKVRRYGIPGWLRRRRRQGWPTNTEEEKSDGGRRRRRRRRKVEANFIRRSDFSCSRNKKLMRNASVAGAPATGYLSPQRRGRESNQLRRARNCRLFRN